MPRLKGLTLTLDEVSQTIDLNQITGVDLSERPDLVLELGQKIIDKVLERTSNGKDVSEKPFAQYSDQYKDSRRFKLLKDTSKVNMQLTGEMLGDMDIIDTDPSKFKFGFRDEAETKKAFNHNTGDTVPKRQFFGIRSKDLKEIVQELRPEIKAIKERKKQASRTALEIVEILSSLRSTFDTEGFSGQG